MMNDTAFLYENGVMNCETKEIDVNEISLEETSESFAKKFNLSEKNQNFLLFDALDEKETGNITVVRNILADEHFQEKYHIKALFTSRYFDEERKRTEGRSFYTLQKEQDLEKYITTYQNFLSNSRQKQTYITLVNQVAEQLGSDFSPLLIGMLVLLVDNKEIRGKVARNTLQRSDIYEAFISEYLLREEKKADSIHDGTEEFYNPIYEESKVKLLETLVEDEFHNTGNEVWTPDIRLSKKMEEHGQEFLGFFPAFLEKLSPEDQKLFNKEKFALFLQHLENLGFLQRITSDIPGVGGQYNFGLSRLHKSFYDYIGYETVKEKSLDEYFQGFMDIALSPAPNHRGIREYLISRFFDSKKELIPFIERLRAHQFEVRRAMGSDFFALISDFL
ncbi:MAG: hypothetical protein LBO09_04160 [Candidatus Peribacteria bacterium]|nr:hypothetical protein [Candidatus Peribacteria bacterium]